MRRKKRCPTGLKSPSAHVPSPDSEEEHSCRARLERASRTRVIRMRGVLPLPDGIRLALSEGGTPQTVQSNAPWLPGGERRLVTNSNFQMQSARDSLM